MVERGGGEGEAAASGGVELLHYVELELAHELAEWESRPPPFFFLFPYKLPSHHE